MGPLSRIPIQPLPIETHAQCEYHSALPSWGHMSWMWYWQDFVSDSVDSPNVIFASHLQKTISKFAKTEHWSQKRVGGLESLGKNNWGWISPASGSVLLRKQRGRQHWCTDVREDDQIQERIGHLLLMRMTMELFNATDLRLSSLNERIK